MKRPPQVGLEPTANRLTADRSTTELLRITEVNLWYPIEDQKSSDQSAGESPLPTFPTQGRETVRGGGEGRRTERRPSGARGGRPEAEGLSWLDPLLNSEQCGHLVVRV